MSSFEEGLTQLMMQMEELKRSLSSDEHVEQWQLELEAIVEQLDFLMRKMLDDPASDVKKDMYAHCQQRVMETCRVVLCHVTAPQANRLVFDFDDMKGQAAIARMMELSLLIEVMKDSTSEKNGHPFTQEMINMYANYQKAVLRQRCKPAIAHLAHWRKNPVQKNAIAEEDDENHIVHPHSNAITVILGQASALIHPLLLWKSNLTAEIPVHQMCHATITILNEQAQSLVKTVSDWFFEDKRLDEWMEQTVDPQRANVDLAELDGLVEEMAFSSQVLARYNALMQQENTSQNTIEQELLPEWTWKYASLERFLGMQQWKSALALATPVNIVVGSDIKVPSVVEDAQYLSSRALDRATSTLSSLAMGTVAHSLSNDIWSTDIPGGVYQALMDQRGCWIAPDVETTKQERKTKDSFASALLDALDDDIKSPKSPPRTASAPASGGFLGSLSLGGGQQALLLRLDTNLCKLNGIFSASAACKSLAQSLDAWLSHEDNEKTMSMIQLAREELERYSQTYAQILELHVKSSLLEWCGSLDEPSQRKKMCIHDLREFFWEEDFELDNDSFIKAESDARLEKVLLDPLRESPLISQLSKCDYEVSLIICQELSILVADLVIRSLWGYNKVFTDWGSLLLSKQVRMLQRFIEKLVEAAQDAPPVSFVVQFEKLSQVVTILQLERPSDWCIYQSTSVLTVQELRQTMSLHKSFSAEAITAICQSG
jgi:hypothetical protein